MFIPNPHDQPQHSAPQHFTPEQPASVPQPSQMPLRHEDSLAYTDKRLQPQPVVKVLSPYGVEYVLMTLTLLVSAASTIGVLLSMVNGDFSVAILAFPVSVLLVALPVFAFLFLRLKKLELLSPHLRFDASKRRSTQFTQILSFLASFFTLIGFVFATIQSISGESEMAFYKILLNTLAILAVTGGIFAYYWLDEHKG